MKRSRMLVVSPGDVNHGIIFGQPSKYLLWLHASNNKKSCHFRSKWYLLGVKYSSSHAQIGLLWGLNSKFSTSTLHLITCDYPLPSTEGTTARFPVLCVIYSLYDA